MPMTVLFPDRRAEFRLDDEAWQGIEQDLEDFRGSNWWSGSSQVMIMAIISADEINISKNRGLELINHPQAEAITELPPRAVA